MEDENRFLKLSEEGQRLAELVELNDKLLEILLGEVLGVSGEQAEIDACKIEHLLSIETSTHLSAFVNLWRSDSPEVEAFKALLKKSKHECTGDSENCDICTRLCIKP